MGGDVERVAIALKTEDAWIAAAARIERCWPILRSIGARETVIAERNGDAALYCARVGDGKRIFLKVGKIVGDSGVNERRPREFLKICGHAVAISICGRRTSFRFSGVSGHCSVAQVAVEGFPADAVSQAGVNRYGNQLNDLDIMARRSHGIAPRLRAAERARLKIFFVGKIGAMRQTRELTYRQFTCLAAYFSRLAEGECAAARGEDGSLTRVTGYASHPRRLERPLTNGRFRGAEEERALS